MYRINSGLRHYYFGGGEEVGEQGREIEEKIQRIAHAGGLRIVRPNCMGIIRPGVNLKM